MMQQMKTCHVSLEGKSRPPPDSAMDKPAMIVSLVSHFCYEFFS